MSVADEIEKLNRLKQEGAINEQEFQEAKARLLAHDKSAGDKMRGVVNDLAADTNLWGMFIHLSQFCGFVVPMAGLIVPIVLWQIKKDESEIIDQHGRIVVNWIITEIILAVIFLVLSFVFIGIPLLIALSVLAIVFPIIGGIKAYNGEVWKYPCAIGFFPVETNRQEASWEDASK